MKFRYDFKVVLQRLGLGLSLTLSSLTMPLANATNIVSKPNIVVSFSIIEDLVKQIGKEHVDVASLIDQQSDVHDFEPRVKHILLLKNAELFIFNGLNFEPWVDKFLGQNNFGKAKLNLGAALNLAPQDQNPHVWQDPELLLKYVVLIKETLIQLRPEFKNIFEKNANDLITDIQAIHTHYLAKLKNLPQPRWLITPHNGFYHLAKAYGFAYIYLSGTDHNENISAKKIKQLIDQIKPLKNAFLFNEWGTKSDLLTTIQTETKQKNGGVLIGDSLTLKQDPGATIQDYLKYNNEVLFKLYSLH